MSESIVASRSVSVNQAFDSLPFTPYQIWVCCLCFLIVVFDGFDLVVMGLAIPGIADTLKVGPAQLGLAISAGQVGPLIGAVVLGSLADRFGRKSTIIASALLIGVFTYLTIYISSPQELALYRFLGGIGMGGIIPNAMAYGSEYAPKRLRVTLALYMWAGMPFGVVVASFTAAWLLPLYGWTSLFIVGGIAPIVMAVLMVFLMPESLHYMVRAGNEKQMAKARVILAKIDKGAAITNDTQLTIDTESGGNKGGSIKQLFVGDHLKTTILMSVAFFLTFYVLWILLSWVPTLLRNSGATPQQFSLAFAFLNAGSFISCLVIGALMAKFGKLNVVKVLFLGGFFVMVAFGYFAGSSFVIVLPICVLAGMVVNGGTSSLMGVVSDAYPPEVRATGIGWAYGVGKIGTLIAPALGGLFIEAKWSVLMICTVNGLATLVIGVLAIVLQRHMRATQKGGGW
jgi:MFS transporter, AAHS family, 4-hydroxybenzoate transporter